MRIDADGKDIEEARMVVVKRVDKFCFFVIFVGSVSNCYQCLLSGHVVILLTENVLLKLAQVTILMIIINHAQLVAQYPDISKF